MRSRVCGCIRQTRSTALRLLLTCLLLLLFSAPHSFFVTASTTSSEVHLGTSLLALPTPNGLYLACDSRTSVGGTYVTHRWAHKMVPITHRCVVLRSGAASETQQWVQQAQKVFEQRHYKYGISTTVSQVAHWLRTKVTDRSSLLVAGFDDDTCSIYSILPNGSLLRETGSYCVAGSGSMYMMGFLEQQQETPQNERQAIDLCRKALQVAMEKDASSGGIVTVLKVTKEGRQVVYCGPPELVVDGVTIDE